MAKNKKRNQVVNKKRKQLANAAKKEMNPFEMRINKQKYDVLGRKSKNDRGMPGTSRSKALQKRKNTLLNEFKMKSKSNSYVDRRFGENDADLNPEDKAVLRFAAERKKSKSTMYNLNDEEELTHLGRSIGDMDKFDVPSSESDDEERLQGDVVKKAHFGGFLTKKDSEESEKSHKAIMEEIIADRIQRKQERQREKENNLDLTEQLDGEWKDVQKLMLHLKQGKADDTVRTETKDDYDIKVRELKFESKGRATDKLKTPEEIAFDEKQKLERLEMERIRRMNGETESESVPWTTTNRKHLSADGLDDDYDTLIDSQEREDYEHEIPGKKRLQEPFIDHASENDDDNTSNVDAEDGDSEEESSGEESEDSFADVLSDVETSDHQKLIPVIKTKSSANGMAMTKIDSIPFILECPTSFQDFFELVSGHTAVEINVIVERIIKCNHPSLGSENKIKMENFFTVILQYIDEICSSENTDFTLLDHLIVHFKTLLDFDPSSTSKLLLDVIAEKREDFLSNTKPFPDLSTLIFLKLVSVLYPTSDFHHPIVTPTAVFMSEILTTCKVLTAGDLIRGLFVCSLYHEFVAASKRLVPEAINYLNYILTLVSNHDSTPNLSLKSKMTEFKGPIKLSIKLVQSAGDNVSDDLIGQLMYAVLSLLEKFSILYRNVPSFSEIFYDTKNTISGLQTNKLNSVLVSKVDSLKSAFSVSNTWSSLVKENRRPPTLKLFEPQILENFDGKKQHHGSKKKLEQQKLLHKYKKEMKGAMREVRLDNHFIASTKLNEQLAKDSDRKLKLKRLYHDLASQEGEFKKYKKKK